MSHLISRDDLPHTRHAHELVGNEHGLPISLILVHAVPGTGPAMHRHPYPEVFVIEQGRATFRVDDTEVVGEGGQIVIAFAIEALFGSCAEPGREMPVRVMAASPSVSCKHIDQLSQAINRLAMVIQQSSEASRAATETRVSDTRQPTLSRTVTQTHRRCTHPDGHKLTLRPSEALMMVTPQECPCCGARLWISIPSVAAVLETANDRACSVPDLEIELTRRERQVLDVLYRSPHPLRHRQLAALVWSEPDRTHGVRTVLHRLRRKLRDSSWSIPFPARGKGVRLVADVTAQHQAASSGARPDDASGGLLRLAA